MCIRDRSMGIGQGELQLTTLQMAHAAAIIANEGTYTDPHLLKSRVPPGKAPQAEFYPRRRVSIDYRYFEPVIEGMSGAVRSGTAKMCIRDSDTRTGQTIAVGTRAMQMHEKTHQFIKTIRPLKDGVIADFQAAENMIEGMINMIGTKRRFFTHLKMVVCIPSGITEVEKRAVFDSADHVDSKETFLIFEPMAAALGLSLIHI